MGKEGVVGTAERVPAQNDRPDGADGLFVGNGNVAARWVHLDDHLRNDGNAHSCTDHAEQTYKAVPGYGTGVAKGLRLNIESIVAKAKQASAAD